MKLTGRTRKNLRFDKIHNFIQPFDGIGISRVNSICLIVKLKSAQQVRWIAEFFASLDYKVGEPLLLGRRQMLVLDGAGAVAAGLADEVVHPIRPFSGATSDASTQAVE